jgi:lipopolysaccharide export system protein LptC
MAREADAIETGGLASLATERLRRVVVPGTGYSRFVALMKLLLPAIAVGLVLLIAVWPRLELAMGHFRLKLPKIDIGDARELRMVNARYSGIDKHHRPYVLTADTAQQMPNQSDLVSLEGPKADMTMNSGAWIALTADTGVYLTQPQLLDLFGDVKLFHDRGYDLSTESAHVDLKAGTAEGHEPVEGQGVLGDVTSQGFRLEDHGAVIVFTGKAKLHLLPHHAEAGR